MRFLIIILLLSSCSASYHLNKAVKKGAELEVVKVPVYLYDTIIDTVDNVITIKLIRKDTIWSEKTLVKYVPKTRIEVRFEHKRFKDSLRASQKRFNDTLRLVRYNLSLENKRALKELKIEKSKSNRLNRFLFWFMAFFVILLIIYILGKTLADKLLK